MTDVNHTTKTATSITLPAQTISPGDLMDRAIDKLRTVHLALSPENTTWLDDAALMSVWATLDEVIRDLKPVRDRLQGVEVQS